MRENRRDAEALAWLARNDPELALLLGRSDRDWVLCAVRFWYDAGDMPRRLPCGCWLGRCPDCGRWSSLIGGPDLCQYGRFDDPRHDRLIEEFGDGALCG